VNIFSGFDSNVLMFTSNTGGHFMSMVTESEYNGQPLLVLKNMPDDKFPFQFGLKKAELILRHMEDVKAFVRKYAGRVAA